MKYWEVKGFNPMNAPLDLICGHCGAWIEIEDVRVYLGSGMIWWEDFDAPTPYDCVGCSCDVCRKSYCPACRDKQFPFLTEHSLLGPEVPVDYYKIRKYGPLLSEARHQERN